MQAEPVGELDGEELSGFSNTLWKVHVNPPQQAENASVSAAGDMAPAV